MMAVRRMWATGEHTYSSIAAELGMTRAQVAGIVFRSKNKNREPGRSMYVIAHGDEAIASGYYLKSVVGEALRALNADLQGEPRFTYQEVAQMAIRTNRAFLNEWRFA